MHAIRVSLQQIVHTLHVNDNNKTESVRKETRRMLSVVYGRRRLFDMLSINKNETWQTRTLGIVIPVSNMVWTLY
jgi:hypothetical protein